MTAPSSRSASAPTDAAWAGWYERYLSRAAGQSARVLGLYREVMARIARGELAPAVLEDGLAAFLQTRGAAYAQKIADLSMRFLSEVVQAGVASSDELLEAIAPGTQPVPGAAPPTPGASGASDWASWFARLADFAVQRGTGTAGAFRSILDRVAAGELEPARVQEAASSHLEQRLPERLEHVARLYVDLLTAVDDVRSSYGEEYLSGILAGASRRDEPAPGLDLVAPLGTIATSRLAVANTAEEASVIRPAMGDVRRADGIGPAFVPAVTIAPEELELAPGEEVSVSLSVSLSEAVYVPGPVYVGSLCVASGTETLLDVPVRIRATPPAATPGEPSVPLSPPGTPGSSGTPGPSETFGSIDPSGPSRPAGPEEGA